MKIDEILNNSFDKAKNVVEGKLKIKLEQQMIDNANFMISKIENNKSLISALVTSFIKKIIKPDQDIRLHRTDFKNGYSARVLDTNYTTPFFKRNFSKYANKETAFLTLSTRERVKWTKEEGKNLKIRDQKLKEVFLNILDEIEKDSEKSNMYLITFFVKLIQVSKKDEQIFEITKKQTMTQRKLNINMILEILHQHFSNQFSSRLPVIAIYSIYKILMSILIRYKNKKLIDLEVHTSSDKHSLGDIEIYDNENNPFEIIEIKHNIPITKDLIFDIIKKIEMTKINRYYILTTFKNGFENEKIENEVNDFILKVRTTKDMDIIANGIFTTMKYYLRFIDDYKIFLDTYTETLINDAKNSTEVKGFHIESWKKILSEYTS